MKTAVKLWIGLAILVVLTPLGLLMPICFKSGSAWGEWGADEIEKLAGYIPVGFKKISGLWSAPMQDYAVKGWEGKGLPHSGAAYIISAITGIVLVILLTFGIGMLLRKKDDE